MIVYRGIGKAAKGDPWSTQHYAIYFTTSREVAEHYGKTGGVFKFDLSKCKIIPTSNLADAFTEAGYDEFSNFDYSEVSLDSDPLLGARSDAESIALTLGIDGVMDKYGNVELVVSECARLLGKAKKT